MNIKELITRSSNVMKVECSKCKGVGCDLPEPHEDCRDCPACNGSGIKPVNISKKLMAIITDLCKSLECWEKDYKCILDFRVLDRGILSREEYYEKYFLNRFESYLASVFIGLFDILQHKDEDLLIFRNSDFDLMVGDVHTNIYIIIGQIWMKDINFVIRLLFAFCNHHNINIDQHIQAKLEYLECVR